MSEEVHAENSVPGSGTRRARALVRAAREVPPSRGNHITLVSCLVILVLMVSLLGMLFQNSAQSSNSLPSIGGDTPRAELLAVSNNSTLQANAGPDKTVTQSAKFVLDGSASTGNITNYTWTFRYGGLNNTIKGMIVENLSLAVPGVYNFTLTVTDRIGNQTGNYSTDTVQITVVRKPFDFLASYWQEIVIFAALIAVVSFLFATVTGRIRYIPEATQEKLKLNMKKWRKLLSQTLHNPMGLTGTIILVFFIAMAIFGPAIAPYKVDLTAISPFGRLMKPSPQHWLGTDDLQQDIFSELLYGARTSIIVGIFSAIIASVLGALVGLYSGYAGGWKDEVIMRANDVVLSIPWLVLMIVVAALLRTIDLTGIILIIGLTGWSTTARMVRAQVLSLKERQFVERARSIGASDSSIIRRHILPNAFPLVFANTILTVAVSILSEATLSFLSLRPVNTVTWGTMLSYAHDADAFHIGMQGWIILPGLCIVAVVLGFTLLGYALDDIMNPKLRKR
jgi:peptide/nickel transport system permease protein